MKKSKPITVHDVIRLVKKYRKTLQIEPQFRIMCAACDDPNNATEAFREAEAYISVQPEYFYAELVVNTYNIEPDELELAVLHELTHIVLWPLGQAAKNALGPSNANLATMLEEQATERFSRALHELARKS